MKAFGVKVEKDQLVKDTFDVWPENWDTVKFFLRCQTQWRIGGMGSLIGLDYGAVAWLLKLYEVQDQRQLLEGLQTMESAVLAAAAKRER